MACRRDTLVIRIAADRDCDLIDVVADLEVSRFISYCLSIKKTSSSALSAFYLGVWGIVSGVETLKLIAVCGDVIISVDVTMILNANKPWSVGFSDSVDWVEKFKMGFVARFGVDDDAITVNEVKFDDGDNAILIDEAILVF